MSWAMAAEAANTRPETTARMVAKATAHRKARNRSPMIVTIPADSTLLSDSTSDYAKFEFPMGTTIP